MDRLTTEEVLSCSNQFLVVTKADTSPDVTSALRTRRINSI